MLDYFIFDPFWVSFILKESLFLWKAIHKNGYGNNLIM